MKKMRLPGNICFSALVLVALISSAYMFIKTDFSGDWILDSQKSSLGEMGGRMAPTKLKVTQESNIITIVRTNNGQAGEVITTDKLTFDGKESVSVGGREGSIRKAALKLADDQNTLTVSAVMTLQFNGAPFEINSKENWSMSSDGKVLTIDAETTTQMGVTNTKLIFNKQ